MPRPREVSLRAGSVLDRRYELIRPLGGGGMGSVFLATDRETGEQVAVKVLARSPEGRTAVAREFEALSRLDHTGVVRVTELHERYYTMEYVEGKPLSAFVGGELPRILDLGIEIAGTLAYIHSQGIIHRDLKPENILVTPTDEVKIMDFGLALSRIRQGEPIAGTVQYMAPELLKGFDIDPRADLYSLGIILYQLVTRRLPFESADLMATVMDHIRTPPPPPRSFNRRLPEEFERVILKAIAKDPMERHQTAEELVTDLTLLAGRSEMQRMRVEKGARILMKPAFIGREREMERLEGVWRVVTGGPQVAVTFLVALPGLGASRLLTEFAGRHLSGDCLFVEVDLGGEHSGPLGSLSSVVSATVPQLERIRPELAADLHARWGRTLVSAAPELAAESERWKGLEELDVPAAELRESLLQYYLEVAGRVPLGFLLHQCERTPKPLADFLVQLVVQGKSLPLWLAGTLQRDEEGGGEVPDGPWKLIAGLELPEPARLDIELGPLADEEMGRLLASLVGRKELEAAPLEPILRLCQGRALLGVQLFRDLADAGQIFRRGALWQLELEDLSRIKSPEILEEALLARLGQLSPGARLLLAVLSLADERLPLRVCAELAGLKKARLEEAGAELERTGYIHCDRAGNARFVLPLPRLRKRLREEVDQPRRVAWHGQLAARLEKILDVRPADLRTVAEHYRKAGQYAKALELYTRAGEAAKAALDTQAAIENYERALDLASNQDNQDVGVEALGQLGSLHSRKGDYTRAIELYRDAIAKSRPGGVEQLFFRKGLAFAYFKLRKLDQAREMFDLLLAAAPRDPDHYVHLASIQMAQGEVDKSEELLRKGIEVAKKAKDHRALSALYLQLGRLNFLQGLFHNAMNFYQRALELLDGDGGEHLKSRIASSMALFHLQRGETALAYKHLEDALYLGEACGDLGRAISASVLIGMAFEAEADLVRAGQIYRECLERAERHARRTEQAKALLALGRLAVKQMDPENALRHTMRALKIFRESHTAWGTAHCYFHLGEALLLMGNVEKARSSFAYAERRFKEVPMRWMLPRVYSRVVELLLGAGELDLALKTLNKALAMARDLRDKAAEGMIYHRYALYCEKSGHLQEAREHFLAAQTALARPSSRLEAALADLDYGRFLIGLEKRGDAGFLKAAGRHLGAARDVFTRAVVEQARQKAALYLDECNRTKLAASVDVEKERRLQVELARAEEEALAKLEELRAAFEKEIGEGDGMDGKALLERFEKRLVATRGAFAKKIAELRKKNDHMARQLDQLAAERKNLLTLQEINYQISSTLDSAKLLELILDTALGAVKAERGFIVLQSEKGETEIKVARNLDPSEGQADAKPSGVSASIVKKVIRTGEPVLTSDAQADGRFEGESIQELRLKSILCVPLQWKTKTIGALYADNRQVKDAFSERELDFLTSFSHQASLALENALLYEELRKKEQIEQELAIANRIQQSLLPRAQPSIAGLEVCGKMLPARQVGGDYYDFIQRESGLTVAIGDVSGKGVPAGLVMVMARLFLHHWDFDPKDTRGTLLAANKILHANTEPFVFMSMLLLDWEAATRKMRYTGAGHESLLVYRGGERKVEVIPAGGVVLGIKEDISAVLVEKDLPLAPGDALLLYTDGATEAQNPANEMYQLKRLRSVFKECGERPAAEVVDTVFARLQEFMAGQEQHDDITVAVLRRTES